MKKIYLSLFFALAAYFVNGQALTWMQKNPIPIPTGTYSACSFTINNLIYVAGGCASGLDSNYQFLWEYNSVSDSWTQMADMPLGGTYGSSAFVLGGTGYVVTGWHRIDSSAATIFNYSYKYDPSTNVWDTISQFPFNRYGCVAFELNGKGYLGTGYSPLTNDWWEYDAVVDAWTQKANLPSNPRLASHGFSIGGYGYVCMGGLYQVNYSDVWQYDAGANNWTQKANYPDTARSSGATFVLDNKAYLMGGSDWSGDPFSSIYRYDPAVDQWTFVCFFPGGVRHALVTAVANNKVYIGQGSYTDQNANTYLTANDWWECTLTDANTISGKVFIDFDNDQLQDTGDIILANKMVTETNTGRITFTRLDGTYDLFLTDTGNYSVTTAAFGYYLPVPPDYSAYFSGINQEDSLNDFALQADTIINDLCATITPMGAFRAGFDATYVINYSNLGTTVLPATIIFYPDSNLTYVSASVTPTAVTPDSVVWNIGNISPFQTGSITVTVNINTTVPIGTWIISSVLIEPVAGDANPTCNYNTWEIQTTGSFDPNEILVNIDTLLVSQLSNPPYLEYIINFQNTGNDTAFNIDILNQVPVGTELNSLEFVASSHTVNVRYITEYNTLGFKFNNILLPDSNVNEPLSHGFVRYRIKPLSTLIAGNTIENTAGIYFDFNSVVLTNTALTLVINPVSVIEWQQSAQITVWPNPVKDIIYLDSPRKDKFIVSIFGSDGKCVKKITAEGTRTEITFKNYPVGVYLLQIKTSDKTVSTKFLKH